MFFLFLFPKLTQDKVDHFIHHIKTQKEKHNLPGTLFIGIVHNNKQEQYFIGKSFPDKEQTVIPIASLTKAITAHLICILAHKGFLSLEDPLKKYFPDLKLPHDAPLTIKDILAQRMGVKSFSGESLLLLGFSLDEIYQKTKYFQKNKRPKVDFSYQNFFFGLLERVIEKTTNKTINEVAKDYIFDPLDMKSAHYLMPKKWWQFWRKTPNFPPFYVYGPTQTQLSADLYKARASMGVVMSCADMMKWLKYSMTQKDTLLPKEILNEVFGNLASFEPKSYDTQFALKRLKGRINYGLGWYNMMYAGHKIYFHMASRVGIRAYIAFDPKEEFGLIIFHNYGGLEINMLPEAVRAKFLDIAYDCPEYDWIEEVAQSKKEYINSVRSSFESEKMFPTPAGPLDQFVGCYEHAMYGIAEITKKNDKLYMKFHGAIYPLTHHNGNKFIYGSKTLGAFDKWIYFGYNKKAQMTLQSSAMYEGESPLFVKIS
ncbi:MAG: serine hydrolase [Alphaproteobacteria bacterium]|nr:MAG: serine hydrolase [Alphaproteobacteria bacterium]